LKIKRFFAKDIRSALDEIKISLGPDAIIMSNKNVDGGVEIVAAIDEDSNATLPTASTKAPVSAEKMPIEAPVSQSARVLNDDQVSLSGFQQRLIKQQAQYQAHELELDTTIQAPQTRQAPSSQAISNNATPDWASVLRNETNQDRRTANPTAPQTRAPISSNNDQSANNESIALLRQEMAAMRQLLEHQVSGLMEQEVNRRDPIKAILIKSLLNVGFSIEVSEQLTLNVNIEQSMEQALNTVANTMSSRVLTTNDDILSHGGVVALLGPTGVGKTTTVAKLAARCAMQYGSDKIAMITTDCYRIGAFEQLNTYGKILGCPVIVAKDAQQLADAIYQCRDKRLVLIDTAGMGQRDIRLSEQLSTLVNSSHVNIRSYLVLPATAQRKVLEEAVVQFRKMPLVGCIITKMDEAIGTGDVLSVAITHSLPLAYMTNGQRVPEDIGAADPQRLINSVIEQLGQADNSFSNSPCSSQFSSFNG